MTFSLWCSVLWFLVWPYPHQYCICWVLVLLVLQYGCCSGLLVWRCCCPCYCSIHSTWFSQFGFSSVVSGNFWSGEVLFSFLLLCAQLYYLNMLGCCALHFRKSGTTWWECHICTSDVMIDACSGDRCSQNAGICDTLLGQSWLCKLRFLGLYILWSNESERLTVEMCWNYYALRQRNWL